MLWSAIELVGDSRVLLKTSEHCGDRLRHGQIIRIQPGNVDAGVQHVDGLLLFNRWAARRQTQKRTYRARCQ